MLVTLFLYLFLQVSSAVTNKDKWCDPDANHGEHTLERGSTCVLTEKTHVPEGKKLTLGATSGNGAMPIITVAPHGLSRERMFLVSGELQISDIIIENHHGGAAIGTSALNVTIHLINSIIRNCTCSVEISQCWGGAVAQHGGTLILEKSQIESNTALRAGGIYTFNTNIQVIGGISSLSNNNARSDCGGALYLAHGTLSISGAGVQLLVQGNTAAICGGGMQIQYSTIQVSNGASMIIKNNSATSTKYLEEPKSRGGGIFLAKTSLEISGDGSYLLMDKNTVYSYGGSIYAATESVVTVSSGAILKVTNSRGRVGGGVHISRKSNIDIHGHGSILLIDGNTAQDRGGGVYAALEANIATSSNAHVIVTNNRAHSVGGGFCVEDSGTRIDSFKSASVQMKDNVAHQNGGAIALRSGAVVRFASSSMFQSNRAVVGYGGAIAYDDNNGLQNGGSGCTKVLMEVVLHGQEFNYVDVIDKDERLESKSSKSIFISTVPTSVLNGYAMRALIADKTTSLCIPCGAYTFVAGTGDNTYLPPNSFISLIIPRSYNNEDDQMLVNFSNVLQEESTPQTDIRISCVEQSSVKVADAHFVTNFAELHGGAIATSDSYKNAFMSIENTTFVRNTAKKGKGGAIRISGSQTAINVSHATFIGNEANFGGAISIDNAASMHMADTVASDNIANLGNGGFIFVRVASPIFLRDVHINTGHAMKGGGGGGAIYSSMVAMERVTVTGCRAGSGGGGGLLLGGEAQVHLLDCLLKDNQATSSGGHIFVLASTLLVHSKGVVLIWPNQEPVFPSETNLISNGATSMTNSRSSLSGGSIFCLGSQSSAGVLNIYDQADVISAVCSTDFIKYRETSAVDDSYACASKGVFLGRETSIRHSTAESGGGVSANLCTLHMSNITIFNGTSTKGNGGAILVSMESTLHVDGNTIFEASNSLQGSGGAISCEECGLMSFSGGTVFQSNSAQKSGGAIHLSSPTKPIVSRGSKYKGNSAQQLNGGAVDMHGGTNWTSIGDSFDGNVALSGSGGALSSFGSYIQFDAASLCVRNQAPKGGGGCLLWEPNAAHLKDSAWGKFAPVVSNLTVIQENNALYGISFATPGASLRIVNTTKMFVTNDKNMLFPRYPFVEILDYYGSATQGRISKDIDVVAKLHGNSHAKLFGATTSRTNNHGRAAFSGLGLQGIPSTKHELYFEASLNLLGTIRARFLNTSSLLPTSIQMCGVGLFLSDVKLQCEYCPANSILSLSDGIESKIGSRETLCLCNSDYYREISSNDLMTCLKCPARSIAPAGSTSIKNCKCNAGFYSTENHAACVIADWVTSDQCDAFSFLNDTSPNKYDWRCLRCPRGGSCYGLTTASNLLPSTGYWQCPTDPQKFVKCKGDGSMCIGRNVSTSIYNQNRSSMCNSRGRYNPSTNNMLCLTCQVGWAPGGRYGCVFCKNPNAKTALLAIAGSFCVFFFVLLIVFKVKSTGRALAVHSTLKRTVFTHLQMLAIVISLNVQFPPVVVSFIDGLSAVILDIGRSSDAHCSSALPGAISSAANLHYGMLITSVLSPILVSLLAFVYWIILVPACPHVRCLTCFTTLEYWNPLQYHSKPQKQKRTNRKLKSKRKIQNNKTPQKSQQRRHRSASLVEFERKKSTLDIFFATLVFFGYLTLPIIVRLSLRTFLSESVCGNVYFATDFAVNYTSDLHVFMMMGVALPSVILYGFVTTSLVFVYMMKNQHLLETRRMTFRIGLLYSGFRKSTWWWEALVFVRKISVILVATFIEHPYLQLMFSWGILFLLVVAQLSWKPMSPYSTKAHARCPDMLHIVEMSSLLILMSMVWAASYFERDDNCSNNDPGCQVLGGFIILTNCLFLLICVGLFFGKFAKHHNFTRKLKSAQSFIQKRSQSKQNVFETKQQVDKRELSTGVEVNHLINMEHDMVSIELANGVRSNRGFGVINPLRKSSLKLRPDY